MYNLEDVVDAGNDFHVGFLAVEHGRLAGEGAVGVEMAGEVEEAVVVGVLLEERIVFVGQRSPEHIGADVFTPLELADEGDAVEDFSVHIPGEHERGIAVGWKFHVVDEVEGVVLHDIRQVGCRHHEQGVRHFIPLHAALQVGVDFSP